MTPVARQFPVDHSQEGVMTSRKTGALIACRLRRSLAVAVVVASSASAAAQADRDRLGIRLEGRDGAVRQPRPRGCKRPCRSGQRPRGRQGPAAEDHHVRHAGQQAGDRQGVRGEADRPGRRRHLHDVRCRLRRTRRAAVDQRGQAHGRAVHRHRPDGPEALRSRRATSPSRSATSRRTKGRRWPSTHGPRAGRRRRSPRTR